MVLAESMAASLRQRRRRRELAGMRVVTFFSEASTRTRLSFEMAARGLGADVSHLDAISSSVIKGESLVDTVRTVGALGTDVLVMRHRRAGAPYVAARHFPGHVVNAGDGCHAHPTQALADLFTLRQRLAKGVAGSRVAIVGDIRHSRVARSDVWSLTTAGAEVTLCGPAEWLAGVGEWATGLGMARRVTVTTDLDLAIAGVDAVMALRVQRERLSGAGPSLAWYSDRYRLTRERLRLADPNAVVMHPGPINEGMEIDRDVAAGPHSVILDQVASGVPVRMAVLALLVGAGDGQGLAGPRKERLSTGRPLSVGRDHVTGRPSRASFSRRIADARAWTARSGASRA